MQEETRELIGVLLGLLPWVAFVLVVLWFAFQPLQPRAARRRRWPRRTRSPGS